MPSSEILYAVRQALQRRSFVVRKEMMRGVNSLATVASVAPLVGIFGTLLGIANSFRGIGTEKFTAMVMTAGGLSDACVPAAFGLLVGLGSLLFYRYLTGQLEALESDMSNASLELVNQLSRFRGTATLSSPSE